MGYDMSVYSLLQILVGAKDKSAQVKGARQWILGIIPIPAISFDREFDAPVSPNF